jgi:hypothetical protein
LTIKRGGIASVSGNINRNPKPSYCPKCEQVGIKSKLGQRLYKPDEFGNIIIPADHDQWWQCYHCGALIPRHDIPQKGELTTDIEVVSSKFHVKRESEHDVPKPKHQRGFNERLDLDKKQGDIASKDPELKKELRKGAKLLSYTET